MGITSNVDDRGIAEVVMDNPPVNALTVAGWFDLARIVRGLGEDPGVRVVVLRAEGRAFCAGLDLTGWTPDPDAGPIRQSWRTQRMIAAVMQAMRKCPQPVIAAAQGPACGGGFSLLLASDVRYGAPDLRMNAAYIKIGLGGCDMGASYFLPRLV